MSDHTGRYKQATRHTWVEARRWQNLAVLHDMLNAKDACMCKQMLAQRRGVHVPGMPGRQTNTCVICMHDKRIVASCTLATQFTPHIQACNAR